MKRYTEVYRASLEKWGAEAQYDQAVEECAELIAVLKHFRRGKVGEAEVVSELADVVLMVGQLAYMFGEEKIEEAVEEKLRKLHQLLTAP
jgi:NTP pyrophosphatase (non-canonical NTP hydrolase)